MARLVMVGQATPKHAAHYRRRFAPETQRSLGSDYPTRSVNDQTAAVPFFRDEDAGRLQGLHEEGMFAVGGSQSMLPVVLDRLQFVEFVFA